MTTLRNTTFGVALVVGLLALCFQSFGDVKYYESGLPFDWEFSTPRRSAVRQNENEIIGVFLRRYFGDLRTKKAQWREWKKVEDSTHTHHHYHYFYQGRRVEGVGLSLHYNLQGWVEYGNSDLEKDLSLNFEPDSPELRKRISGKVAKGLYARVKRGFKSWKWEPILWRNVSHPEFLPAYEIAVSYEKPYKTLFFIVDQDSGEILTQYEKTRRFVDTDVWVFKNSILKSGYDATDPTNDNNYNDPADGVNTPVTIRTDLATRLDSSALHIYRDQDDSGVITRQEIYPAKYNYVKNPASYASDCTTASVDATSCPNQSFDGVNVFYHLTQYRNEAALTSLSPTLLEPLTVIVNSKAVICDGATNNACYSSSSCGSGISRCLVFLPPAVTSGFPSCGTVQIHNLAREGFVIAHEYQHFITDQISGIEYGASGQVTVGDALHEGYSDYGAASYMSYLNGTDVTLGLLSFPVCTGARRDVQSIKVYQNSLDDEDPHMSGLSWASGLWKLRSETSKTITDLIALKSLYFLGSNPGFLTATESLVKADRALYDGAHVNRIREIFYSEVKFLGPGSQGHPFKDPSTLEANVGFRGCGGVGFEKNHPARAVSGIVFLIWGILTLFLGRLMSRRPFV